MLYQPILQYAIFPAQFAFLYSYYPSGRLDDISKKLADDWKVKHFEASEKEFEKADQGFVRDTGPSFFQKAAVEEPEAVEAEPKEPAFAGLKNFKLPF